MDSNWVFHGFSYGTLKCHGLWSYSLYPNSIVFWYSQCISYIPHHLIWHPPPSPSKKSISITSEMSIWVCLKIVYPLNPMILLIIILLNGYFIGNINPTFSDTPIFPHQNRHPDMNKAPRRTSAEAAPQARDPLIWQSPGAAVAKSMAMCLWYGHQRWGESKHYIYILYFF